MNELVLRVSKNNLDNARFVFVVSKKVALLATDRNRIKRLLRESVRHLPFPSGFDYMFIAKTNLADRKEQEVESIVAKLLPS